MHKFELVSQSFSEELFEQMSYSFAIELGSLKLHGSAKVSERHWQYQTEPKPDLELLFDLELLTPCCCHRWLAVRGKLECNECGSAVPPFSPGVRCTFAFAQFTALESIKDQSENDFSLRWEPWNQLQGVNPLEAAIASSTAFDELWKEVTLLTAVMRKDWPHRHSFPKEERHGR